MNAKELADAIGGSVNSGIDVSEFRTHVQREHNYLQQVMFDRVVKQVVVALAGQDYFDARNERAVERSREIADHMGWDY